MKTLRENASRTRKSLFDAASEVFANKGYRDATIAEICKRAGTNIAAVNYHFRNKETLYIETWRQAFRESIKAHPPDGGASADDPPEERLQAHVVATIRRMANKNNKEFWFLQREFANPTGLLDEVLKEEIEPLQMRTAGLVRELLGPLATDMEVRLCEISIISQCINPMVAGRPPEDKHVSKEGPPKISDIEAYAYHVAKFSLAGIREIRRNLTGMSNDVL